MALVRLTRVLWNVRYPEHSSCRDVLLMKVLFYLICAKFRWYFYTFAIFSNGKKRENIVPIR